MVSKRRTKKGGFCDDRICTDVAPTLMSVSESGISHKNPIVIVKSDTKEPTVVWVQSSQEEKGGIKSRKGLVPTLGARMGTGGRNIPMIIEDSGSDSKDQIKVVGNIFPSNYETGDILDPSGISKTLKAGIRDAARTQVPKILISDASGPATTTSTPTRSIPSTSEKRTIIQATLGESIQGRSPTLISFVLDFLARRFRLRARGRVSKTLVERFSSRYAELRKLKDLHCYSSKTLRDFFRTTEAKHSTRSFNRWKTWGIGSNGRFLTADISEFPRIGNECSLSDILQDPSEVYEKYFLSDKMIEYLRRNAMEHYPHLRELIGKAQANKEPQ